MTRSQLITKLSRQTGLPAGQVENVLDSFVDEVIGALRTGDKVTVAGFGRFEMRGRKTKAYVNPKTKVPSQLQPTSIPGFKASGLMKQRIAEGK